MIYNDISLRLSGISNSLLAAARIVELFSFEGHKALLMVRSLEDLESRLRYLRLGMAPKPDGTRFRSFQLLTASGLREAGLSEESLPQFLRLIESAEHRTPQTEGSRSILRQMKTQGAKEQELSGIGSALAIVEILGNVLFPSYRLYEGAQAR